MVTNERPGTLHSPTHLGFLTSHYASVYAETVLVNKLGLYYKIVKHYLVQTQIYKYPSECVELKPQKLYKIYPSIL